MIHVLGKDKLTTADLEAIPVERPERAGCRWQGVSHYELATTVERHLADRGIEHTNTTWVTSRKGQALFGGMSLRFPSELNMPEIAGMNYALGIRHSNDMAHSMQFFSGLSVTICSNGVATGSHVLARRHTSGVELGTVVDRGVTEMIERARDAGAIVDRLRERPLDQRKVDHLLCEAGRMGLMCWSHLGKVERTYREPPHEEFRDRNAWSLYNAFNNVIKSSSADRQLDGLDGFRQLLLN